MRNWLSYLCGYSLAPHEAAAAQYGFTAFACILSSYFILLPLREDVALTLGPAVLPRLFTASLLVTAITAPLVTTYVLHPTNGSRARGFRLLCRVMAGCLTVLWAALLLTSPDPGALMRLLAPLSPRSIHTTPPDPPPPPPAAPHHQGREAVGRYGSAVRVTFYVYLSLQSLLSTSAMWAVCADTFTTASSTRVYGFLGAGATLGQLLASGAALGFGEASRVTGAAGASLWLLLPAAGLLLLAAHYCQAMIQSAAVPQQHPRSPDHSEYGPAVQPGQSYGSGPEGCTATVIATSDDVGNGGGGAGGGGDKAPGSGGWGSLLAGRAHSSGGAGGGGGAHVSGWIRKLTRGLPASHASRLVEGFRLIAASPYLQSACAFLALNYATSASLYFLRAVLVARADWLEGSADRIAFFAALNTASAGVIFAAQLLLTGRVLTSLGVGATLMVGPAVSLVGMAVIMAAPSAATIAGVEVVRKVVQYALSRPCREVLFTVVSRREKYGAKVVLDTVVQRLGDAAAAALFEVVGVRLGLGPPAVAAAGLALCCAHLAVAAALGRMYGSRKAGAVAAAKQHQQELHAL